MKNTMILIFCTAITACGGDDNNAPVTDANNQNVRNNNGMSTSSGTAGTTGTSGTVGNGTIGSNNTSTSSTVGQTGSTSGTTGTTGGEGPTIDEIFDTAFSMTGCTSGYCHGGAVDGLVLMDSETARTNMVGVTSTRPECGLTKLVVAGDPGSSLLWMRVRPAALDAGNPCATKMPKGTDGLDAETAQLIHDWIAGGAR